MPNDIEGLGGVLRSNTTHVFTEGNVKRPVHTLNPPVSAFRGQDLPCTKIIGAKDEMLN